MKKRNPLTLNKFVIAKLSTTNTIIGGTLLSGPGTETGGPNSLPRTSITQNIDGQRNSRLCL